MKLTRGLVMVALAGCASNPGPGQPDSGSGTAQGVQILPQVGEFRQIDVHHFPMAEAGTAYRYSDDSPLRPDVYLYPLSPAESEAEPPLARAQREARLLLTAMEVERRRGRFDSFQLLADSVVRLTVPGTTVVGSHMSVLLTRGGEEAESHQHVFVLGDQFMKVRTTFPRGTEPLTRLEDFIKELVAGATVAPLQEGESPQRSPSAQRESSPRI